jgi:hypothetical protein
LVFKFVVLPCLNQDFQDFPDFQDKIKILPCHFGFNPENPGNLVNPASNQMDTKKAPRHNAKELIQKVHGTLTELTRAIPN